MRQVIVTDYQLACSHSSALHVVVFAGVNKLGRLLVMANGPERLMHFHSSAFHVFAADTPDKAQAKEIALEVNRAHFRCFAYHVAAVVGTAWQHKVREMVIAFVGRPTCCRWFVVGVGVENPRNKIGGTCRMRVCWGRD